MELTKARAEILVRGLVQGVGFRYFAYRHAEKLGLIGYVRNLYSGEVHIICEGNKKQLEEFYEFVKTGPMHAHVKDASIKWGEPKNEFSSFEIRH